MENYVKLKVFYWVVGLLVVLNLTVLGVMWFGKPSIYGPPHMEGGPMNGPMGGPPDGPPGGPMRKGGFPPPEKLTDFFKYKLEWSDEQTAKFEPIKEVYEKESTELFDSIRVLRKEMFDGIFAEDFKRDEFINRITDLQRRIDLSRYEHFKAISEICTPEQREKFKELLNEVFIPLGGPRGGPPGGMPPPPR